MTYARARLLLGISGVGTFVLLALAGIAFGWPALLDASPNLGCQARELSQAVVVYVLLSIPFDVLGGWVLPRRFGRGLDDVVEFGARWLRGVCVQAVVMVGCALVVVRAGAAGGLGAAVLAYGSCMLGLLFVQPGLARLVGVLRRAHPPRSARVTETLDSTPRPVEVLASHDPGFTGGIVGPPGGERIVLPANWLQDLSPWSLAAVLRRRAALSRTTRIAGIALAIAWNLAGFALAATVLPGAGVSTVPELVTTALGAALWTFLGLLVLPTPSRAAVLAADAAFAKQQPHDAGALTNAIAALDQWQDDEPERSRWVERVFHPIPSVRARVESLNAAAANRSHGAWHAARTSLFLTWGCLGLLSRAVHCNAGRPDLWVLLPCD